jgi:CubicO group peptidase (beta-lactamase class C family)
MPNLDQLLPDVDVRLASVQREAGIPGMAWGVLARGGLVHEGGAGTMREPEDRRPDADTVFRIASMTKSFTATTVLLLRDDGALRLDDPVALYVPELADWRLPTADSAPVTVRQLLTMSAGLATDDPWGDRQQDLPLDRFAALLAADPTFAWPPGTTFEYSNLGYGILGRVITNAAGREYREVVRDRLLRPLGLTSTVFLAEDVDETRLAHGYVHREDRWIREGTDGYGALAAMGGLFSTVRDLARWIAGFVDAFPARDDPEGPHPLRRSSRREMQQVQRATGPWVPAHAPDTEPTVLSAGYGFGLSIERRVDIGTIVRHGGGYPGFGSHMAWHPASGLGVVTLGNLRYAPVHDAVLEMLKLLVEADVVPRRRPIAASATAAFRPTVEGLIEHWDDAIADEAFAMNMDLDEPRESRRASVAALAADEGPFVADDARPVTSASPADLVWWLRGRRGWIRVSILVSPEPRPRLQQLAIVVVGDPSQRIRTVADRLLAVAAEPAPAWPLDLTLPPEVDRGSLEGRLRTAGARLGALRLGLPMAGDGRTTATFAIDGERGAAELTVGIEPATGAITAISLRIAERAAPAEAW